MRAVKGRRRKLLQSFTHADAPGLSTTPLAGELYVCSTDQLGRLDALEDHPSYYQRRRVRLRGDDAEAWMYVLRDAGALANVRARPDAFFFAPHPPACALHPAALHVHLWNDHHFVCAGEGREPGPHAGPSEPPACAGSLAGVGCRAPSLPW